MSAFRDALARSAYDDDGDAILAMPEMQAIKATLVEWAHSLAHGCFDDVNHGAEGKREWRGMDDETQFKRWVVEAFRDYPSVAAWLLDGGE